MKNLKLSFGETAFMKSVLSEAGRVRAGTLVTYDHTEGRAVAGLAKKGLVVKLDGQVQVTESGAAWLAEVEPDPRELRHGTGRMDEPLGGALPGHADATDINGCEENQ
ncbi:hypothetical protein A9R05_42835 (plasmid) [Burkholderia sp. KK1]|uniref:hypothetical protein n=1 Tax=Burkholderia sp. M701 TaxID=326454 RepID=UPI000979BC2A|nr:hypothetical protein [Burkholderia sp. M701]AQH05756.1 hypothetical protein A9R05_42835 [Burkholderia sp. KK1]